MIDVKPDAVWTTERKFRRVIHVVGDLVCYSVGGDRNRFCLIKTFDRWVKKCRAKDVTNDK